MVRGGALVGAPPLLAVLLYVMATTRERLFHGGAIVLFHLTFELMRVLCEAEGARCVARARYRGSARFALVGGINTCVALALQSALQALLQAAIPELEMQFKSLAALLPSSASTPSASPPRRSYRDAAASSTTPRQPTAGRKRRPGTTSGTTGAPPRAEDSVWWQIALRRGWWLVQRICELEEGPVVVYLYWWCRFS